MILCKINKKQNIFSKILDKIKKYYNNYIKSKVAEDIFMNPVKGARVKQPWSWVVDEKQKSDMVDDETNIYHVVGPIICMLGPIFIFFLSSIYSLGKQLLMSWNFELKGEIKFT